MRILCAAPMMAAVLAVYGCSIEIGSASLGQDQCLRQQIFQQCLKSVPAGPTSTKYNDWSEVVEACGREALKQSQREKSQIKPECMVGTRY